jgi:hypothetical protein
MRGLSVGVVTARFPECKRGLAVNLAASLARAGEYPGGVCVADLDPLALDVSTRLPVRGPVLEDFAGETAPDLSRLGRVHSPALAVLPAAACFAELGFGPRRPKAHRSPAGAVRQSKTTAAPPDGLGVVRDAAGPALHALRAEFDVVIADVLGGPTGAQRVFGLNLEALDWLLLAVTPQRESVEASRRFLELFGAARRQGVVRSDLGLAIVRTGDESCTTLDDAEVEAGLGFPVAAGVPQLWGRAQPNLGFGAALSIPELDRVVVDLFARLARERGLGMQDAPELREAVPAARLSSHAA